MVLRWVKLTLIYPKAHLTNKYRENFSKFKPMAMRIQIINSKRYVSSYALYRALELPTETIPYHQWIKTRVLRLNTLEKDRDYIKNEVFEYEEIKRGPKPDDYHITTDLALAICIFADTAMSKSVKKVLELM